MKKTAAESYRLLREAYGEYAPSQDTCERWFRRFKSGDFDVADKEHGKPPKRYENAELQALLDEDDAQTQKQLAQQLSVSQYKLFPIAYERWERFRRSADGYQVIFLYDNAPSHTAKPIRHTLEAFKWEVLPHAVYSPDLAPFDYHLFASMDYALAEQRFRSYEDVKK